jgi:thiol-disulfide isomerase/thioredoxin
MALDAAFVKGVARDWGIALVLALAVYVGWQAFSGGPEVGSTAPDFTLRTPGGEAVTLSELRGQTVVINFWATWCGPCKREIPDLNAYQEAHPEVRLLGISVDENLAPAAVEATARRLGAEYTVLLDPFGVASDPYGVSTLPTTVVVDPHGHVTATRIGTVDQRGLERLVAQAHD